MNLTGMHINPFRIASVLLFAVVLAMLIALPGQMLALEDEYDAYDAAKTARDEAKSRQIQLTQELAEVDDEDFIERTARREYGYCWYGETIYRVGNLDELSEQPFEGDDGETNDAQQ